MSDSEVNPFEAPQSDLRDCESTVGSVADLRNVAGWQRTLILCLLAIVIGVPIQFVSPIPLKTFIAVVFLIAFVIGAFFIFRLSARFWGTVPGVLLAILSLAPPIGLAIALFIIYKARALLKAHGIKVGLLWTSPAEVDQLARV